MAEIFDLDTTAANNTARFPENMQFRNVNDSARELEAMLARDFKDRNMSLAASGSSNAFAVTTNRTITSYTDNLEIGFTANHTITGPATLNVNGLGAKAIVSNDDSALTSGDIVSGARLRVVYRSAAGNFQLVGPARSSTADVPTTRTISAAGLATGGGDLSANRTITVPAASQAEAQAGTATTVAMTPERTTDAIDARIGSQSEIESLSSSQLLSGGNAHHHPGVAKAWLSAAVSGGTPSISASYNITSITDVGTGLLTITIDTDFSSANWAWSGSSTQSSQNSFVVASTKSAGSISLRCLTDGAANIDPDWWSFIAFGDQ